MEDIRHELHDLGHNVRNIINVHHRITKEPLNLLFVDLEPARNNKNIYDIMISYRSPFTLIDVACVAAVANLTVHSLRLFVLLVSAVPP